MLTYQEAEDLAAQVLAEYNGDDPDALCGDEHFAWADWTDDARAVLEAVGYTDLLAERDALAATVARVEALMRQVERYVLLPDLAAALHPKRTDASLQWVLDCDLAPDGTDRR